MFPGHLARKHYLYVILTPVCFMKHQLKGRGAQSNTNNRFLSRHLADDFPEGIDEELIIERPTTQVFEENAKKVVNKVTSPDLGMMYSMNAYQGCEHGCSYCYARNSHQYYGFSAGLDFETKIMVKRNAPQLLEKFLLGAGWNSTPIMLSGNTDCYQPLESKYLLTRKCLEIFLKYQHPVSLITKNKLILRDLDLLTALAEKRLVHVFISINTLQKRLRGLMEPRTATPEARLETIARLTEASVPTGVMTAPIIPGLNDHELPEIIKRASEHGALGAGYTALRLNDQVEIIFREWLKSYFPDRYQKVINLTKDLHGGKVGDSQWSRRIVGEGKTADMISGLFRMAKKKYLAGRSFPTYDLTLFQKTGQLGLFD